MQNFNNNVAVYLSGDITAATILEKIKAWVDYNTKNERNFINGHFWTYNTIKDWCEQLVFCSPKVFYQKISKLRKLGLIYTEKFNRKKGNHTLWYTVNYDLYNKITSDCNNSHTLCNKSDQNLTQSLPDKPSHISEGKTEIDFPKWDTSINVTTINNNKKGIPKKRGWYQPPEYQDFDSWTPPEELQNKIKEDYGLNDEQIKDAHNEFTLYNKAKKTKFRCLKYIFILWCKRYRRFKVRVKGTATKAAKVITETMETVENKVIRCIEAIKDINTKHVYYALLRHFGINRFNKIGLHFMRIEGRSFREGSETIEFINFGNWYGDEVYSLRRHRDEILEGLKNSGYTFTQVLVCGA